MSKTLNPYDNLVAATPEKVTAAHTLDDTEVCPRCHKPMQLLTVSSRLIDPIPSMVCVEHRISLPVKNKGS